jgi:hypothetical protein
MPDLIIELHGLRDAAYLTGFNITNIRPALPELGLVERGVDVLFDLDSRRFGAQHTVFHSNEGHTPGKRGSALRAKEESRPGAMYGKFDFWPALRLRICEKIAKAARYNNCDLVAKTWLVISANLAGAPVSTRITPAALRADDLNVLYNAELAGSKFERALLVLHLDQIVWGWDREGRWRLLADPGASEREQRRKQVKDLIFDQIPAHFRGACRNSGKSQAAVQLEDTEFGPSDQAYVEELISTQGRDESVPDRQVQRILRELRHGPSR